MPRHPLHEEVEVCCRGGGEGFTLPGAEASYAPDLSLEPKHLEVRLRFDLEAATAEGGVTTTVRCNREGARTLRLNAVSFEEVKVLSPIARPLAWRYDGKVVEISWDEPFHLAEERKIEVRYRVSEPITGLLFQRPDSAYPDRPLLVCSDHETERARYWLPCVDYPAVRTTFDFHITAKREHAILANGLPVGETDNGDGTKTAHWHLEHPCPSYLCCLAIGRLVRFDEEPVDGRPVAYFGSDRFTPEMLRRSFGRTPEMLRWIEKRLGNPFPFRKYYQIAVPEIGGAMENISLVTWDDVMVLDETLASELQRRIDSVNIHEMAHSYFGDAVVCRHFEHSWLKESWATYIESVWLEERAGRDDFEYELHRDAEAYFEEADQRYVRPIVTRTYNSSWDLFDRHLYPGGAWRLHMLRHVAGDGPFWAAVRDYLKTYAGRTVETEDFRKKVEEHSGLNLVRFFDQWIHAPGYPKLKIAFRHDAEKGEGTFTVEQTQECKEKGIGLFSFDLEIEWDTESAPAEKVVCRVEKARQVVQVRMAKPPLAIRVDPGRKTLFSLDFNPGEDLLRRAMAEGRDVWSRIRAVRELIKTGSRANFRAVREAMRQEPFWGVREAAAVALGNCGSAEAIEPIATLLLAEPDPKPKAAFARAAGRIRDPRLRDALRDFLAKPQPYWARAAALESLGFQRDDRDLALLDESSRDTGLHAIVRSGALLGLGTLRSERAFEALERRLPYGAEPEAARPAAVVAYGRAASLLPREIRERASEKLRDLLRDRRPRVRMAAASALADLGLPSGAADLERLKRLHAEQDAPRIERLAARLRQGVAGEEVTALKTRLEKLEERLRKAEEQVQDLKAKP